MSKLDISKAAFSGASLTTLEYVLEAPKNRSIMKASVNGSMLTLADLLVQSLAGGSMDELRTFLYKEHEDLTIAVIYTLIQELKDIFYDSGYEQYQAIFPKIVANLFFASGSIAVGSSINRMLGMDEGFIQMLKTEKKLAQGYASDHQLAKAYEKEHKNDKKSKSGKREIWNE